MLWMSRSGCRKVVRVLQDYLDGEVSGSTRTMVAEHLEQCRRCGLEASTYRAIKSAIAASAPDQLIDAAAVERLRRFAQELADHRD